ncbi:MAG TPA: hypothetical protein VHK26_10310 [Methyloceanibacter sp.]|nr:hypothetical protein [Methyloceanibacter sp.]
MLEANYLRAGGRKDNALVNSRSGFARKVHLAGALGLALAFSLAFIQPAGADVRIISSSGGTVGDYLNFFAKVKQSGSASSSTAPAFRLARWC